MFKPENKTKTYYVESTNIITKDGVLTTNNEDFNSILSDGDIVVAFGSKTTAYIYINKALIKL